MYDPEAVYQDDDILQAQYEREARDLARDRARGICHHHWRQGWRDPGSGHPPLTVAEVEEMRKRGNFPDRPTEGMPRQGQALCLDCGILVDADLGYGE